MKNYLTEKQIIKATGITPQRLKKLLELGIIEADPYIIFGEIHYSPDTIDIILSMQKSEQRGSA